MLWSLKLPTAEVVMVKWKFPIVMIVKSKLPTIEMVKLRTAIYPPLTTI